MQYYAVPEGSNYAIYQVGGGRVSTVSANGLSRFGLSTSNLGSNQQTNVAQPQNTGGVDQTYYIRPGETDAQYRSRVQSYNASKSGASQPQVSSVAMQDPLISQLLSNPEKKTAFDSLDGAAQQMFMQTASSLNKAIENGKVVNPNISISPEQLKQFYDQASSELDPHYTEQFSSLRGNLDLSLARMSEDYTKAVTRAEDPFKQALAAQAETEAQQGTAFSSERNRREATAVSDQTNRLSDAFSTTQRNAQDLLRGYESNVGTNRARSISMPNLTPYSATTNGFSPTSSRTLDPGLLGGISFGTLGSQQETAKRTRQNELEQSYRQNRVLDYSSL